MASVWVGTNDTGATDTDPTGGGAAGNNMVIIVSNIYDGGSAGGDGNLTQTTQYVSATSGDTRVSNYGYDFRDRMTNMTDAASRYGVYTYDNLDRMTQTQFYATSGGTLYAQSQTNFDDRNRVYQTLTYGVNTSTGAVGNALTSNTVHQWLLISDLSDHSSPDHSISPPTAQADWPLAGCRETNAAWIQCSPQWGKSSTFDRPI